MEIDLRPVRQPASLPGQRDLFQEPPQPNSVICGDCLEVIKGWPDNCVDLIFGSPPYEAARTYGIGFNLAGQDWVDWMVARMREFVRVSKGLVAMVVEGQTKKFRYSATPALLMADLHRAGIHLRKPPAFRRVGIPGSGGPDWLRNDYEFVVCATSGGKLPWSDNVAMGSAPKYAVGGAMSNRHVDGSRMNGSHHGQTTERASPMPDVANPGNVIDCGAAGGGNIGSNLAHENEAPFPQKLAEFFIASFCPPGGTTCDPFSGSGTTASVSKQLNRRYVAIDIRENQTKLTCRRLKSAQPELPIMSTNNGSRGVHADVPTDIRSDIERGKGTACPVAEVVSGKNEKAADES